MNSKSIFCRNKILSEQLRSHSNKTVEINHFGGFADFTSQHTDLQIFIHNNTIISHADILKEDAEALAEAGKLLISETRISQNYPNDIAFNACFTGKYLIHNIKFTAPEIIKYCESIDASFINVNQGYARCTTIPVDENSIITCDQAIARSAALNGVEVLTVTQGHIELPGFNYGFIGGTSGVCGDTVYFNGNIERHPDFKNIAEFLSSRGKRYICLHEGICIDTGSIFFIG